MCEDFLGQSPPLRLLEALVKAQKSSTPLQTIPRHLELVHRVHILYMHLDTRSIRRFRGPEVQVFVPPRLKVERIIAVV